MSVKAILHTSIMVLAALTGTVPTFAAKMTDYDVTKADTWADALAICDVTRFLLSDPKLESDVIIAAAPNDPHVALYKPYFIPPSGFYSDVMKQVYERVLKAGLVTSDAYSKARLHYAQVMFDAYSHDSMADKAFLAEQMKTCYALAVDTSGKARNIKHDTNH
ncbi:MAG TPA: hypothetical protein VMU01_08800 [Rhizomicrobium sp.]|nr:hypothetical protein [Rhizomicrobium sp.]